MTTPTETYRLDVSIYDFDPTRAEEFVDRVTASIQEILDDGETGPAAFGLIFGPDPDEEPL